MWACANPAGERERTCAPPQHASTEPSFETRWPLGSCPSPPSRTAPTPPTCPSARGMAEPAPAPAPRLPFQSQNGAARRSLQRSARQGLRTDRKLVHDAALVRRQLGALHDADLDANVDHKDKLDRLVAVDRVGLCVCAHACVRTRVWVLTREPWGRCCKRSGSTNHADEAIVDGRGGEQRLDAWEPVAALGGKDHGLLQVVAIVLAQAPVPRQSMRPCSAWRGGGKRGKRGVGVGGQQSIRPRTARRAARLLSPLFVIQR